MKIESVRIVNFRSFKDEIIYFDDYSCFVGRNGAGKSTILYALNVFFRQDKDSKTDLSKLEEDDFHHKNTEEPIKITITFNDLSDKAKEQLSDYVRQDRLIVSSVACFDTNSGRAEVKQYGNRLGFNAFRKYFEADKNGAKVEELRKIFSALRSSYPDISAAKTKGDMVSALHEYEAQKPDECDLISSEDLFYGATKGANKLAPHIQWIFVPATKDFSEEAEESKNSALGQLLTRTVRSKIDFSKKVTALRHKLQTDYQAMLDAEQDALDDLSASLEMKLRSWSHPQASAHVLWKQDPDKSVKVEEPWAYIKLGERGFSSDLSRFGHGLQRSYLLTLLQELANLGSEAQPTLVMGIEEPELYQHPPQARHLADVLHELSLGGSQILACSHSPLFIPGDNFEAVRVVREQGVQSSSVVTHVKYCDLSSQLNGVGLKLINEKGMLAKLYPALNPVVNEMFFCSRLILVEGIEDSAYISTGLMLNNLMDEYRKYGCHIVPVGGKSELAKPLAMALQIGVPAYVVFDCDTDKTKENEITQHKLENSALQKLLGCENIKDWPDENIIGIQFTALKHNLTKEVESDFEGEWQKYRDKALVRYGNAANLKKNPLVIAYALECAWNDGMKSKLINGLVERIIKWARGTKSS
jgi:predicted ATP-dependent endonuclease of OLD family